MGHYSAGFTLDTYGHLMESRSKQQVEWIDELVFPEGFTVALNLHLSGAPQCAAPCRPVQPSEGPEPASDVPSRHSAQSDATGRVVPRAGFEPALPA